MTVERVAQLTAVPGFAWEGRKQKGEKKVTKEAPAPVYGSLGKRPRTEGVFALVADAVVEEASGGGPSSMPAFPADLITPVVRFHCTALYSPITFIQD